MKVLSYDEADRILEQSNSVQEARWFLEATFWERCAVTRATVMELWKRGQEEVKMVEGPEGGRIPHTGKPTRHYFPYEHIREIFTVCESRKIHLADGREFTLVTYLSVPEEDKWLLRLVWPYHHSWRGHISWEGDPLSRSEVDKLAAWAANGCQGKCPIGEVVE